MNRGDLSAEGEEALGYFLGHVDEIFERLGLG